MVYLSPLITRPHDEDLPAAIRIELLTFPSHLASGVLAFSSCPLYIGRWIVRCNP